MNDLSTGLLIGALLLLPLTIWSETSDLQNWQNRLVIPHLTSQPDRHTPQHTTGTTLPTTIQEDLFLTPTNNPIILSTTTHINTGVTLHLAPGTALYANEFSSLVVEGQLVASGTKDQPILFTSNELHPLNQTWSGVTVVGQGQATLSHTIFHYASPALTCMVGSNASLTNSHLTDTTLGVFTKTPACHIKNNRINSTRDGIIRTYVRTF